MTSTILSQTTLLFCMKYTKKKNWFEYKTLLISKYTSTFLYYGVHMKWVKTVTNGTTFWYHVIVLTLLQ